ncbi:MAG: ABC transporter permease [Opitutaceae bacterium]|jgi:putative ABC transport system permease protein|nr:ABC transporter permease [Opitutaceae bacterium]
MRLLATNLIALRALRRNKLRSTLTALGMIIGVGAVIATVSIGNGAKAQVQAQIAALGQNVITVFPGSLNTGGMRSGGGSVTTLSPADADAILNEIPGVVAVSPESRDRQQILANGLNWNTTIYGESPEFLQIRSWDLDVGDMFTQADVRSAGKVCIIGGTVAEQLFGSTDPVGQTLRIRNNPFKILGILKKKGFTAWGSDQDDLVVVPYTSGMKRVVRRTYLNSILVQADTENNIPRIQQEVTELLKQRRKGREPDFTVRTQLELAEMATSTATTLTLFLGVVAGISLIVGGIGIMNIMLVSVTERTREIGIRLAIGAHDSDIRMQFLIEAMILSFMGGTLGILLGVGASQLLSHLNGWTVITSPFWVVVSFLFSGGVGVLFGFYPAHKAARLDPIEALRFE